MKSIIASGTTSLVLGGVSFAASAAHSLLSDAAALVGVISGIVMIIYVRANTVKVRKESYRVDLETDMIFARCHNCSKPEECPFKPEHRPPQCKHKTTT